MNRGFLRRHGAHLIAMGAVLSVYLLALSLMPLDVFWHPDEGAKFLGLQAIHWNKGIEYDVSYPGRILDPAYEFYPGRCDHGELYPSPDPAGGVRFHWPMWFPLLSRVFFALFGLGGIYVVPLLSGWLTAVVAGRWTTSGNTSRTRAATTVVVACASPIIFYSLCFSEHTLATLLGTLAVGVLISSGPGRSWAAWAMVPLLFVSVLLRLEMLALTAALIVAWALSELVARLRSVPGYEIPQRGWGGRRGPGFYIVVFCLLLIGVVALASLLTPRHWELLRALPRVLGEAVLRRRFLIQSVVNIFFGPLEFEKRLPSRVWEMVLFAAMTAAVLAPFVRSRRLEAILILPALLILLESSLLMALASHAYLNRQGILAAAPYIIVAPYALEDAWHRRDQRLFRLAGTAACYAAIGFGVIFITRVANDGRYLIGLDGAVRYMLTFYPIGAALALSAVQTYRRSDRSVVMRSAFTILVGGLVGVAVLYQFRGLQMLHGSRNALSTWQQALQHEDRVVTDVWWLAAAFAPYSTTHELYCVPDAEALPRWVAAAAEHGATTFTFASLQSVPAERFGLTTGQIALDGQEVVAGMYLYRFRVTGRDSLRNGPP